MAVHVKKLFIILLLFSLSNLLRYFWIKPNWDYEEQKITGFEFKIHWNF